MIARIKILPGWRQKRIDIHSNAASAPVQICRATAGPHNFAIPYPCIDYNLIDVLDNVWPLYLSKLWEVWGLFESVCYAKTGGRVQNGFEHTCNDAIVDSEEGFACVSYSPCSRTLVSVPSHSPSLTNYFTAISQPSEPVDATASGPREDSRSGGRGVRRPSIRSICDKV
ncbi:unnamed protein product [Strongylus vulgaris]|uniref:Uncharacterized protein n=1 Tax=Strongylus vulgaris TaxID=40348 RepID=A0A3P7LPR4_STRVU|nr:unnamed protein product [Strongylus vulgaris]